MPSNKTELKTALALGPKEHLALVGGGGKTTLMSALAKTGRESGKRVVTTTTTKLWHHEALSSPRVVLIRSDVSWKEDLREGLRTGGHVFVAESLLASGKVQGIDPYLADALFREEDIDYLIVEADGAAGHPIKAHADHEPVIPASTTTVVALIGLEALGRPLSPETVFRENLFREITGCDAGGRLSAPILTGLFSHPRGLFKGAPDKAKRVVFLNKSDMLSDYSEAERLSRMILQQASGRISKVVIGSVKTGHYS